MSVDNVLFKIASEHVENVVTYLLSTSTPFKMEYSMPSQDTISRGNAAIAVSKSQSHTPNNKGIMPLERLIEVYFSENITTPLPKIEEIAQRLGINVQTLRNTTKKFFGKSVYQFSVEKRMEVAAQLLRQGYKACEVSKMVGYGDKSAIKFNKMFQKHFGITPKKFQKNEK